MLLGAIHGRNQRRAPGGDQQLVEGRDLAGVVGDGFRFGVDGNHSSAGAQLNFVIAIPLDGIQRDVVKRFFADQNGRQENAVVVRLGLVTKNGDVELRRVLEDLLNAGDARHAIADNDQAFHVVLEGFRRLG